MEKVLKKKASCSERKYKQKFYLLRIFRNNIDLQIKYVQFYTFNIHHS